MVFRQLIFVVTDCAVSEGIGDFFFRMSNKNAIKKVVKNEKMNIVQGKNIRRIEKLIYKMS